MPKVNIYIADASLLGKIDGHVSTIKKYLAETLSCTDRLLNHEEISIRTFKVDGGEMISPIEIDITAHNYKERVDRSDIIAEKISARFKEILNFKDVSVWLELCKLGHSFKI